MGRIDLSDELVHLYKTPTKLKRWYLPLFGYVLDVSVCNAWLLYKQECSVLKEKPMPFKRFRVTVAHTLKGLHKMPAQVGRPLCTSPPPANAKKKKTAQKGCNTCSRFLLWQHIPLAYLWSTAWQMQVLHKAYQDGSVENVGYSCVWTQLSNVL